jgi:hypothetical protein
MLPCSCRFYEMQHRGPNLYAQFLRWAHRHAFTLIHISSIEWFCLIGTCRRGLYRSSVAVGSLEMSSILNCLTETDLEC